MKMEQAKAKTDQAKAKDVAGPVNKLAARFDDMSKDTAKQIDTVRAMIEANKRPKKIKGPSGKIYEIQD